MRGPQDESNTALSQSQKAWSRGSVAQKHCRQVALIRVPLQPVILYLRPNPTEPDLMGQYET